MEARQHTSPARTTATAKQQTKRRLRVLHAMHQPMTEFPAPEDVPDTDPVNKLTPTGKPGYDALRKSTLSEQGLQALLEIGMD